MDKEEGRREGYSMSERREVRVTLDQKIIEATARKLGWQVGYNENVRGYSTASIVAPIVIYPTPHCGIGIMNDTMIYDNMYEDHVRKFVEGYYDTLLESRGRRFVKRKERGVIRYEIFG